MFEGRIHSVPADYLVVLSVTRLLHPPSCPYCDINVISFVIIKNICINWRQPVVIRWVSCPVCSPDLVVCDLHLQDPPVKCVEL
jgi:hypothetical protein